MSNRRKSIAPSLKEEILSESDKPDCTITELAKKYDVTTKLIYSWRRNRKQSITQQDTNNFVELLANDPPPPVPSILMTHIDAEMCFEDFRFSIRGKLSNTKFKAVIELLSSTC